MSLPAAFQPAFDPVAESSCLTPCLCSSASRPMPQVRGTTKVAVWTYGKPYQARTMLAAEAEEQA